VRSGGFDDLLRGLPTVVSRKRSSAGLGANLVLREHVRGSQGLPGSNEQSPSALKRPRITKIGGREGEGVGDAWVEGELRNLLSSGRPLQVEDIETILGLAQLGADRVRRLLVSFQPTHP
jgi:hypothetical protein